MIKNEFLGLQETIDFSDWLAQRLSGIPIDFAHAVQGPCFPTLESALGAYRWPNKRTSVQMPTAEIFSIPANSSFEDNALLLEDLKHKLRTSYFSAGNDGLFEAVRATMQWGGVYAYSKNGEGGNRGWLESNASQLAELIENVVERIDSLNDDFRQIPGLRFNAGTTKVYSLLCDDFVIYDSRVTGALSWLTLKFFAERREIPSADFRFCCLPAKGNHNRNPNRRIFNSTNNSHHMHAHWNVRANWLLCEALAKCRAKDVNTSWTLRKIEAALFVIGFDIPEIVG